MGHWSSCQNVWPSCDVPHYSSAPQHQVTRAGRLRYCGTTRHDFRNLRKEWLMADGGGHTDEPASRRVGSGDPPSASAKWCLSRGPGHPLELADRDGRGPAAPPWRTFPAADDLPIPPLDEAETRRRIGGESIAHSTDAQAVDRDRPARLGKVRAGTHDFPGTGSGQGVAVVDHEPYHTAVRAV